MLGALQALQSLLLALCHCSTRVAMYCINKWARLFSNKALFIKTEWGATCSLPTSALCSPKSLILQGPEFDSQHGQRKDKLLYFGLDAQLACFPGSLAVLCDHAKCYIM
jgi:hypothetical protein